MSHKRIALARWGRLILFTMILLLTTSQVALSSRTADKQSVLVPQPVYLPMVTKNFDGTLGVPLFGVQMYGATGSSSKYHTDLLAVDASWARVPISWASAEPSPTTPDALNWADVDNNLAAARTDMGELNLIVTIWRSPAWAVDDWNSINNPSYPDDTKSNVPIDIGDLGEFAEFVGAVVERYDGDGYEDAALSPVVSHWEFGNEPDSGDRSWSPHWGDYGAQYAQMLAAVYPAVKAANSQAQVLLGGIAYDWFYDQNNGPFNRDFLDDVLTAGGGDYFDIMNFHQYPAFASNWLPPGLEGPGLVEKTLALRAKLIAFGYGDKPFVITESGWYSSVLDNPPSSPETQARYVVELFTQAMAADIDVMIWFSFYDPGGFYPQYGLVDTATPPIRKPAYYVYEALVAELATAHYVRSLSLSETGATELEVHQFTDNVHQREVYVAWLNPINTGTFKPLILSAAQATVRDFYGNVIATPVSGGGGKVTIQVGGQPIYIEVDR